MKQKFIDGYGEEVEAEFSLEAFYNGAYYLSCVETDSDIIRILIDQKRYQEAVDFLDWNEEFVVPFLRVKE